MKSRMNEEEYALLREFLSDRFGLAFPEHRREMLESRLQPRLDALGLKTFRDYYFLLQFQPNGELGSLVESVTNNESYFFREDYQFQALFQQALPELKKHASDKVLRFLSAGCSSGEEAYTLNIFARENQFRMFDHRVDILGIDIDSSKIELARRGEYRAPALRNIELTAVRRYFSPAENHSSQSRFMIRPPYRQGVRFTCGNILVPQTYSGGADYDAIFCRNVLIYFSEKALHRTVEIFARCLKPMGYLFLGHSESIIGISSSFQAVRLNNCIAYRRVVP